MVLLLKLIKAIDKKMIPFLEKKSIYVKGLFSNYDQINNLLKERDGQLLYVHKTNISDVLYNSDEILNINDLITKKLSDLFYIDLLLNDNPNIIDYIFSKKSFFNLCEEMLKTKKGTKKVIVYKIISDFWESYQGFSSHDEKKIAKKIKYLCKKELNNQIKNDFNFWKSMDIDNIMNISIDKFYDYYKIIYI